MDLALAFLSSGQAALLVLAFVAAEGLLLALRFRAGRGAPPSQWLSPLVAGGALAAVLWLTQANAPTPLLGVGLTVAGVAHVAGYRQRWINSDAER